MIALQSGHAVSRYFVTASLTVCHRAQAAELGKIFVSKANRQAFQRLVSRRTQQAITSVELDFVFPPSCSLDTQCETLVRPPSSMNRLSNLSWCALTKQDSTCI